MRMVAQGLSGGIVPFPLVPVIIGSSLFPVGVGAGLVLCDAVFESRVPPSAEATKALLKRPATLCAI